MTEITRSNTKGQLELIWEALQGYRSSYLVEENCKEADEEWDEICTAMAWIAEDLGVELDE